MATSFVRAVWIASIPAITAIVVAACGSDSADGSGGSGPGGPGPGGGNQGGSGAESAGGAGGSGNASTGGTGAGPAGCMSDADCTSNPAEPKCNVSTGECVGCLPTADDCDQGQFCDPATFECTVGCTDDSDCTTDLTCDTTKNKCVGCVIDTDCPSGSICIVNSNTCVPGCSASQPCQSGFTCCTNQQCYDLAIDIDHCGDCTEVCAIPDNAEAICSNGVCGIGMCTQPWENCDGDVLNGCEQNTLQDGPCVCNPGDTQPCYFGSPGTENVGPCVGGTQTCDADGLGWGGCLGQVLPAPEICSNGIDEDCDTILDNGADQDNDGWTICNGDCCDSAADGCSSPKLINPGAFEFVGNMIDDDCDVNTSDTVAPAACSTAQKFSAVLPDDLVKAIDLCQTTTANPPMPQKKWGVLTAEYRLASGGNPSATAISNMQNFMGAVLVNYGTNANVTPKKGPTMAGISTGRMRDQADAGYLLGDGTNNGMGITTPCPPAYLAGNGGQLPASLGCSGGNCPTAQTCFDSINVRTSIRVPTNALSLSYQFKFYSYEFPEWVCDLYNDFYLALLQTGAPGIPADTNISFDGLGNPFSVNNGFFDVCQATGCHTCPAGIAELAGTGMSPNLGGGSKWLTTDAPIVPGETIVLELMTFDVGDNFWDSNVLIDNFHWNLSPATVGTHE